VSFTIDRILSVDHAFGQLELYVFGQDWPKAIRSTGNSVDKGPTILLRILVRRKTWTYVPNFLTLNQRARLHLGTLRTSTKFKAYTNDSRIHFTRNEIAAWQLGKLLLAKKNLLQKICSKSLGNRNKTENPWIKNFGANSQISILKGCTW
jgi:hypothetical protein